MRVKILPPEVKKGRRTRDQVVIKVEFPVQTWLPNSATRRWTRSAPKTPQRVPAAVPASQLAITPEVNGADWR